MIDDKRGALIEAIGARGSQLTSDISRTTDDALKAIEGKGFIFAQSMTNNSADRRNREYSYPTILQTADGAIHIAYTVWRQKIRYVRIDEKWVTG